ncbi:unnamed protein product [Linum trigynum]|uniref:DNA helicase Pif1-like 2B domain-containing protein n=1 Tax=Linum trigynum TaxID=586398 RepID=A0AAV2D9U0_9ROSI
MRLRQTYCSESELKEIATFSKWIMEIGDGNNCSVFGEANISIPTYLMVSRHGDPISDIIKATYPNLGDNHDNKDYLASRAILAPHHEMVNKLNEYMLSQITREQVTYLSSDFFENEKGKPKSQDPKISAEVLNSLQIPGFPDHEIKLKIGVPVILLRNVDQSSGLCNGT